MPQHHHIVVGLDVGTTKVCTVIGKKGINNDLEIIGVGSFPSNGLKKGSVINIENTVKSIRASIDDAKLMAGVDVDHATVGIAGGHIYSFNSTGVVAVKGNEIRSDDVSRAVEAAKAVVIPSDREIIHVMPQEFKVDNISGIKDPIGMCGVRLEVRVHVVTGAISLVQNLIKCVEQAGVAVDGLILQPLASSESVLTSEEKELGVILVDIGGGTTDIAMWAQGALLHTQVLPIGGNHFTNDLAVALKISQAEADKIKVNHGGVLAEGMNGANQVVVQGLAGTRPREVSVAQISSVLGARAEELFGLIQNIIIEKNVDSMITGGLVLTGGGAMIKGMQQLAEYTLMRPVKIGVPNSFGGMAAVLGNPKYSTALGLLLEANKSTAAFEQAISTSNHNALINRLSSSLKSVFKELF